MFKGTFTALITPFNGKKIDITAFEKLVKFQIGGGVDGIVINGTTGESPNIKEREIDEMFEIASGIKLDMKSGIKIIIGAGANSTEEVVKKTIHAHKLSPDGILSVTPYYNKPTQKGLIEHYKASASAAGDTALILYNVPGRTGCNLMPDTVEILSRIDNITAVKEASANLVQISEIHIKACAGSKKGFSLLSGDDGLTLPILSLGGSGVISVTSNIAPALVKKCVSAFMAGDIISAREAHEKLFELNNALFIESNPIPVKTAAALMGLCAEEFRLPLTQMSGENRIKLIETLNKYKLI